MKITKLLALAAATELVSAHATIFAAWINDVDQGLGNSASGYIRSPPNNSPVMSANSADLTCNVNNRATTRTLSVTAGDKFTFEWHHNDRNSGDDIIADSHLGPILVYIAPVDQGTAGQGWVKIYEDGYNQNTKQWAVSKLIANRGKHDITIPNITPGQYLLRAEIIALHEAFTIDKAQFYMECVQIQITSGGTTSLPAGVSIPGAYKDTDPGIFFNLYNGFTSYTIPGPPVWNGASSGPNPISSSTASTTSSKASVSSTTLSTTVVAATTSKYTTSTVPTTLSTVVTTTTSSSPLPASTGTVAEWAQCGGINYSGPTACQSGLICKVINPYYSQCQTDPSIVAQPGVSQIYEQCGGINWTGPKTCATGLVCKYNNDYYSQCLRP